MPAKRKLYSAADRFNRILLSLYFKSTADGQSIDTLSQFGLEGENILIGISIPRTEKLIGDLRAIT